jgi:hypothetical protein
MITLNIAIQVLADQNNPRGWLASETAPDSYEKLCAHLNAGNSMLVWNGACDNTIFDDAYTNQAFRAWHDAIHYSHGFDFSPAGELSTMQVQLQQLHDYVPTAKARGWLDIIQAEIQGQLEYQERHGEFPDNQKGFVNAYLVDKSAALSAAW